MGFASADLDAWIYLLGLLFCSEGLANTLILSYPSGPYHYPPRIDWLELLLEALVVVSVLVALQVLVDIPGVDLPDIKDVNWMGMPVE